MAKLAIFGILIGVAVCVYVIYQHVFVNDVGIGFMKNAATNDGEYATEGHGDDEFVIPDVCPRNIRGDYLEEMCRTHGWTAGSSTIPTNAMVSDSLQLIRCFMSKAASRTMREILTTIRNSSTNNKRSSYPMGWISYDKLDAAGKHRVMNYTKLIVVRHPLDRLISSYIRFKSPGNLAVKGLTVNLEHINEYFGSDKSFDPAKEALSFKEYVDLISSHYTKGFMNGHWRTYWEHCDPCAIKYNFILRTETLADDFVKLSAFFRKTMADRGYTLPQVALPHITRPGLLDMDPRMKIQRLASMYGNVSRETMAGLRYVYHKDMTLFGYTWYDGEGGTCTIPNKGDSCC